MHNLLHNVITHYPAHPTAEDTVLNTVSRVAFISTDCSGIITSFNYGAEVLTGYSAEEVIGRCTPLLFHIPSEIQAHRSRSKPLPIDGERGYEIFTQDATHDAIDELECTYLRKDGGTLAVYLGIQPLRNHALNSQASTGYLSIARPVPGQFLEDRQIVRAFGGSLFEQINEGVLELARDWTVLYRNGRALEILPNLMLGENIWELYPSLVGTFVEDNLCSAMEHRIPTQYENHYAPLDIWFRVHALPSPSGIKTVFQDITVEKNLGIQLERERLLREKRVEAISHMAGGLAHEISNPLAIIHLLAEDLHSLASETEIMDTGEVKTACTLILDTASRAMAILRGLKGFTREASKDPMAPASVLKIVDDCLLMQRSRFEREHIELRVEAPAHLPKVVCREVQIGQILNNLLNNAFDAITASILASGAQGSWVGIYAMQVDDWVVVYVNDSGPGVPEEARPHLMEPFYTTKEIGGGTGIGLSLSRAIAEDHEGTLDLLEQEGPTCFCLRLPLQPHCGKP